MKTQVRGGGGRLGRLGGGGEGWEGKFGRGRRGGFYIVMTYRSIYLPSPLLPISYKSVKSG